MHPLQLELNQLKADLVSDILEGHDDNIAWFKSEIRKLETWINNAYTQDEYYYKAAELHLDLKRKSLNTAKMHATIGVLEDHQRYFKTALDKYNQAKTAFELWSN